MANEVTLPETRVTDHNGVATPNTRPENQVNVAKPQVQLTQQPALEPLQVGGNKMAVEDMLSDIRREAVEHTNEIIKEGMKDASVTQKAITDQLAQTSNQIDAFEDVVNGQFFTVARDTADVRAQVTGLGYQVRDGFAAAAKDSEINALKTQIETAKQTTYLSDKIGEDGEKTRLLITTNNNEALNRMLVERNAELVEERNHARHWRVNYDQSQFQALTSQLQNFQSQLAETRQGMVNFGTMAGVGQTSTANNVR